MSCFARKKAPWPLDEDTTMEETESLKLVRNDRDRWVEMICVILFLQTHTKVKDSRDRMQAARENVRKYTGQHLMIGPRTSETRVRKGRREMRCGGCIRKRKGRKEASETRECHRHCVIARPPSAAYLTLRPLGPHRDQKTITFLPSSSLAASLKASNVHNQLAKSK